MNLSFSFEKVVKVLKRFFVVMLLFAIAFYALGYYITLRSTSVSYSSYTELYIHTTSASAEEYAKYMETEAKYADTYLIILNTYTFYDGLRETLPEKWRENPNITSSYIKNCVSTEKRSDSAIVRFTVYTYDKELTEDITKALYPHVRSYLATFEVNSVDEIEAPRPVTPTVSKSKYLSLILATVGAVLAFLIGYIKEIRDIRIKAVSELEAYGVPVLGVVPSFDSKASKKMGKYSYSGYDAYYQASAKAEDKDKDKDKDKAKSKNKKSKSSK